MSSKNNDTFELNFLKKRKQLRNEIYDVIKLIQVKMILIFDKKHRSSRFENSVYFKLTKIENVEYHIFKTFSLSINKIEFYKIKKKSTT